MTNPFIWIFEAVILSYVFAIRIILVTSFQILSLAVAILRRIAQALLKA